MSDNKRTQICHPQVIQKESFTLKPHRSIVNSTLFHPHFPLIFTAGVEKIVRQFSPFPYPSDPGALPHRLHEGDPMTQVFVIYRPKVCNSISIVILDNIRWPLFVCVSRNARWWSEQSGKRFNSLILWYVGESNYDLPVSTLISPKASDWWGRTWYLAWKRL